MMIPQSDKNSVSHRLLLPQTSRTVMFRHLVIFEILVIAGNLINKCASGRKFHDPVRCGLHDLRLRTVINNAPET